MKPSLRQYTIALKQLGGTAYGRKKSAGLSTLKTPFSPVALKSIDFVVRRRAKVYETLDLRVSGGSRSIFEAISMVWGAFLKLFLYTRWQK